MTLIKNIFISIIPKILVYIIIIGGTTYLETMVNALIVHLI